MESFKMILTIFPNLLAMIFGVNIFINSGLLNYIFSLFSNTINSEIISMIIIKPISGTASLAILNSIYENLGPDSFIGKLASVIQSSTDTTFYVLTLYFGSIGIKKIKYSLYAGLLADLIGIISSILICNILF
ncbi:MAG: spore maturation protein [Mycoplasmatota bacterium]